MRDDTSLVDIVVLWSPPFLLIFDSLWLRKEFGYECLFIFNCFLTHSYLVWSQDLSFLLHLIDLVNLFAICEVYLFCVCWVDMGSTMSHIYQRLCWCSLLILVLVSSNAWPCHSHIFGWANSYVLSSLIAQSYVCCKCNASFPIYALFDIFCVLNDLGGVRMQCLCTLYSNTISLIGA